MSAAYDLVAALAPFHAVYVTAAGGAAVSIGDGTRIVTARECGRDWVVDGVRYPLGAEYAVAAALHWRLGRSDRRVPDSP